VPGYGTPSSFSEPFEVPPAGTWNALQVGVNQHLLLLAGGAHNDHNDRTLYSPGIKSGRNHCILPLPHPPANHPCNCRVAAKLQNVFENKPLSFNTLGEEQHLRREKGITQVINITQVIRFQTSEITHVYLKLPLTWFLEVIPFTDHQTEVMYTVTTRHSDRAAGETPLGM
jgi:hypothetical protein